MSRTYALNPWTRTLDPPTARRGAAALERRGARFAMAGADPVVARRATAGRAATTGAIEARADDILCGGV